MDWFRGHHHHQAPQQQPQPHQHALAGGAAATANAATTAAPPPAATAPPPQQHQPPPHPPLPPAFVPQGDPTFLYGGFGARAPAFGYAWLPAGGGATSFGQLPLQATAPKPIPAHAQLATSPSKSLAKSASAPDLQNSAAAALQKQRRAATATPKQQQQHRLAASTGARGSASHLPSGYATPQQQSSANTPNSSRPSSPPRPVPQSRSAYDFDTIIGMAAA